MHYLLILLLMACAACAQEEPNTTTVSVTLKSVSTSYLDIPFKSIHGTPTKLADFKGKVMLIVNVASECGNTPQYEGLEKIYKKYKDRGFVVIGFPANNFGEQEPGTNAEIEKFCKTNYGVTFPMMSKISVLGEDMHPLYKYLTTQSDPPGDITWNFNKFLIDREGRIAARYDKKVKPDESPVVDKIEELLEENPK